MTTCIAIDDEPLALALIKEHCDKIASVDLKKTFLSGLEALEYLRRNQIDLVILDINMPEMDGMKLSSLIPLNTQIIFVTAYKEYALKSYDVSAVDYLIKPASFERLHKAIIKCTINNKISINDDSAPNFQNRNNPSVIFKGNKKIYQVTVKDILYVEGLKDYAKIYLRSNEKLVIRESLKNILEQLREYGFLRVHRSFIIPLSQVTSIEGLVIKIQDHKIPLNKISKEFILQEFKKRGILGDRSG